MKTGQGRVDWKRMVFVSTMVLGLGLSGAACKHQRSSGSAPHFNEDKPSAPIPEPGTLLLIGSGLVGIGVRARRRNRRK